jgi:hypothetical protein
MIAVAESYKVSLNIYFAYEGQVTTNFIFGKVVVQRNIYVSCSSVH